MRAFLSNSAKAIRQSTFRNVLALALGVMLFGVQHARAATIITDDGDGKMRAERYGLGYDFTVGNSGLAITSLGIWDDSPDDASEGNPAVVASPDGLVEAHQVGLFKSDGTLIASVTVPAGTGATLIGEFRYVSLGSPVGLLANTSYTLVAEYYGGLGPETIGTNGFDLWHDPGTTLLTAAVFGTSADFLSFQGRVGNDGTLSRGVFTAGPDSAYIGPNALYALPEPSSLALLGVGSILVRFGRRRRCA